MLAASIIWFPMFFITSSTQSHFPFYNPNISTLSHRVRKYLLFDLIPNPPGLGISLRNTQMSQISNFRKTEIIERIPRNTYLSDLTPSFCFRPHPCLFWATFSFSGTLDLLGSGSPTIFVVCWVPGFTFRAFASRFHSLTINLVYHVSAITCVLAPSEVA